jgi:hypothetical protein
MYHTQDFGSIKGMLNNQDENIQYLSETMISNLMNIQSVQTG